MNKILILVFSLFPFISFTQDYVDIPDETFLKKLISIGVDLNSDGKIQTSEALLLDSLDLTYPLLEKDLRGLDAFTNLTYLNIDGNRTFSQYNWEYFPRLNNTSTIAKLVNLKYLNCSVNSIKHLDLRDLTQLEILRVRGLGFSGPKEICVSPVNALTIKTSSENMTTSCNIIQSSFNISKKQEPTIVKAFNLQGIRIPIDTKNQTIIVLYSNGMKEKTYFFE